MSNPAQKQAVLNCRTRQARRGIARFEVQAPEADRPLIRALARRLAASGPEADAARAALHELVADRSEKPGGILAALRRSPLVGADLDLVRMREKPRKVAL